MKVNTVHLNLPWDTPRGNKYTVASILNNRCLTTSIQVHLCMYIYIYFFSIVLDCQSTKYCRIYLQNTVAVSTYKFYIIFCTQRLHTLVSIFSCLEGLNIFYFCTIIETFIPRVTIICWWISQCVKLRIYG